MAQRRDGREPHQLRPVRITPGYALHAEGSALIEAGDTRLLCTVSVEERVPTFLRGTGRGWVTAEYGMLPRSTPTRMPREGGDASARGRRMEIQRLIGRSLRAAVDLEALGARTCIVDCDVLQADGGTRTLAITGAYVALYDAFHRTVRQKLFKQVPFTSAVAAVSAGMVDGTALLDLCYEEDARADVDFNVAMTGEGKLVEVQGSAEGSPFSREELDGLLTLAAEGIQQLFALQRQAIQELTATD